MDYVKAPIGKTYQVLLSTSSDSSGSDIDSDNNMDVDNEGSVVSDAPSDHVRDDIREHRAQLVQIVDTVTEDDRVADQDIETISDSVDAIIASEEACYDSKNPNPENMVPYIDQHIAEMHALNHDLNNRNPGDGNLSDENKATLESFKEDLNTFKSGGIEAVAKMNHEDYLSSKNNASSSNDTNQDTSSSNNNQHTSSPNDTNQDYDPSKRI